ncbi:fumarate hydratase [Fervidicoccus sp.]|uniref:fumarate hydratase n=1 Tax=Fervidicoccus sp. TaxID=2060324 RepID=UPI003D0D8F4B
MELNESFNKLVKILSGFINVVAIKLPDDVNEKLNELIEKEQSDVGKLVYEAVKKNLSLALERKAPLCQDTGVLEFFVKFGENFPYKSMLLKAIREGTVISTKNGFLRPNVVDPSTEKNSGDNTGPKIPWIEIEIEENSDYADVQLYLAGGGASRPGSARTLDPAEGWSGIAKYVIDVVSSYGPPACPPLMVVGVGIGATSEIAAMLSKKALLRKMGERNINPKIAKFEEFLEEELNNLGFGPQGLGGKTSIGEVHVEYAGRHPATLAVGVSTSCWALRKGWIRIMPDLSYEIYSHRGVKIEL